MFFVFIVRFDRYYDVAISLVARWPTRYQKNSERARREKGRGSNGFGTQLSLNRSPSNRVSISHTSPWVACVAGVSNRVIGRKHFFALFPTFSTNSRGNACYAGYLQTDATVGSCWQRMLRPFARDLILSCLFYIKSQRPINQNSNSSNCCQIEWIIKITAHNRRYKWQQIQKEPRIEKTWRTLKRITSVVLLAPWYFKADFGCF